MGLLDLVVTDVVCNIGGMSFLSIICPSIIIGVSSRGDCSLSPEMAGGGGRGRLGGERFCGDVFCGDLFCGDLFGGDRLFKIFLRSDDLADISASRVVSGS